VVAGIDRKIIYEATVRLVVQEFGAVGKSVPELINQHGGYLAEASVDRTSGGHRTGSWQARVPVKKFEAFLVAVSALGVPENTHQTTQDVTKEFVDVEARISNSRRLEGRILELLEKANDEIKDVLEVERELSRVRGEIELMEGRLRFLRNRTDMTTVSVFAREQRDYVPPETPTFVSRAKQLLADSLLALQVFIKGLAIAVTPWLLALSVIVTPIVWVLRRRKSVHAGSVSARPPVDPDPEPPSDPDE